MRDRFLLTPALLLALGAGFGWVAERTSGGASRASARCTHRELRVTLGPRVSPMTGEHAVLLLVRDTAATPCRLFGWPRVVLRHGSRTLPFHLQRGGGPYLPRLRPHPVTLRPGTPARIVIAKYRCDVGIAAVATHVSLRLPGVDGRFVVALPRTGVTGLTLCRPVAPDAPIDPGNRVAVSPVQG